MNPKLPHKQLPPPAGAAVSIALVVAGCAAAGGCVHRRFTVRTNPPGARLFVDDYEIGTTPVSHDFVYYGTRKIRLVKDGYETLTILQPIPTPWWDLPGIDFVSENLIPTELRDHRVLDFQLQPQVIVPTEQLMGRADELRRSRNPNVPTGATLPQGALPQGSLPEDTLPPPAGPDPAAPAQFRRAPSNLAMFAGHSGFGGSDAADVALVGRAWSVAACRLGRAARSCADADVSAAQFSAAELLARSGAVRAIAILLGENTLAAWSAPAPPAGQQCRGASPVMSEALTVAPDVVNSPTVPLGLATNRSLPETAIPSSATTAGMSEGLTRAPDAVYSLTVLPEEPVMINRSPSDATIP